MTQSNDGEFQAQEAKRIEQEIIAEQSAQGPDLAQVERMGKTMLANHLGMIEANKEVVTLTGFIKALRLALVHDVAPELQERNTLVNKQQFLAGLIAQAMDTKFNLKMAQLGAEMEKEELQNKAQSAEGEITNG